MNDVAERKVKSLFQFSIFIRVGTRKEDRNFNFHNPVFSSLFLLTLFHFFFSFLIPHFTTQLTKFHEFYYPIIQVNYSPISSSNFLVYTYFIIQSFFFLHILSLFFYKICILSFKFSIFTNCTIMLLT